MPSSGNRVDTAVKLILVFFIALLSFSIGIFVGKSVSDADYREAALERGDFQKFKNSKNLEHGTGHDAQKDKSAEEISDDEIARLTEEFVRESEAAENSVAESNDSMDSNGRTIASTNDQKDKMTENKKVEDLEEVTKEAKLSKESLRIVKDLAPGKDPKKGSIPDKKLPEVETTSIGKYTIQLASYLKESDAQSHAKKLKDQGYSAFYVSANVNGQQWYRVSVGLFSNLESAQSFKRKLVKQVRAPAAIVQKITK
jgi:septal ring-binding cell division protein DamX